MNKFRAILLGTLTAGLAAAINADAASTAAPAVPYSKIGRAHV